MGNRGKTPGKIAAAGSNDESSLGQAPQLTRFSETAFPMLQVRAQGFAPVTKMAANLLRRFANRAFCQTPSTSIEPIADIAESN